MQHGDKAVHVAEVQLVIDTRTTPPRFETVSGLLTGPEVPADCPSHGRLLFRAGKLRAEADKSLTRAIRNAGEASKVRRCYAPPEGTPLGDDLEGSGLPLDEMAAWLGWK